MTNITSNHPIIGRYVTVSNDTFDNVIAEGTVLSLQIDESDAWALIHNNEIDTDVGFSGIAKLVSLVGRRVEIQTRVTDE